MLILKLQTFYRWCKNKMESSSFFLSRTTYLPPCGSIRVLSVQHSLKCSYLILCKCQPWVSANIAEIVIKIFSSAVKEVKMLGIMCFLVQGRQKQLLGKRWGVSCSREVSASIREYYNHTAFSTTFYVGVWMDVAEKLSVTTRDEWIIFPGKEDTVFIVVPASQLSLHCGYKQFSVIALPLHLDVEDNHA